MMEHEDECYDDWDIEHSYAPAVDDHEFWELVLKKAIARQGPQYSIYQSCMWE